MAYEEGAHIVALEEIPGPGKDEALEERPLLLLLKLLLRVRLLVR